MEPHNLSEGSPNLSTALASFMKTTTLKQAEKVLQKYPVLLTDEADLLLSSLIHDARQQGMEDAASGLDERRNFIRSVRQEQEEKTSTLSKSS